MSFQKIKHILTSERSITFGNDETVIRLLADWVVPKHNETTLYILSTSFIITFLINPESRVVLSEFITPDDRGGSDILVPIIFFIGAALAVIAAFTHKHIPGLQLFFAPAFIVTSSLFLAFEYLNMPLNQIGVASYILALYHFLSLLTLVVLWLHSGEVIERVSSKYKTARREIHIATLVVVLVFFVTYYVTDWYQLSWAIPITTTLFLWQLFEKRKNSRFLM